MNFLFSSMNTLSSQPLSIAEVLHPLEHPCGFWIPCTVQLYLSGLTADRLPDSLPSITKTTLRAHAAPPHPPPHTNSSPAKMHMGHRATAAQLYKRFSTKQSNTTERQYYLHATTELTLAPPTHKTFTHQQGSSSNSALLRLGKTATFPLLCCCWHSPNPSFGTQHVSFLLMSGCVSCGTGRSQSPTPHH